VALAEEKPGASGEYHPPEEFLTTGRWAEYMPQARRYLEQNPHDGRGPRIALDMLMFATGMEDQAVVQEAKQRLLFQFGTTLPAAYLIKTSKADELRDLLKSTFTATEKPIDKSALPEFYRAITLAYRAHGPSLADDELWAQAALSAPDATVAASCRQQIRDKDSDAAKTLVITLDTRLTTREKFVRLQELSESKTARAWQAYSFTHELSAADRADATVQTVAVENLLADHRFAAALEILTELTRTSADPKLLFCRGWAEAATDQVPAAIATLSEVAQQHPESPWAASAQELAAALATLDANLDEHTAAFEKVCADLLAHVPEIVELELHWPADRVRAQLGLDFVGDGIELLVHKADKPLLGYSSGREGARFFVDGDPSIHRSKAPGPVPVFYLNASPAAKGYKFSFNFNFSSTPGELRSAINSLRLSPAFATQEARMNFVRYHLKQGAFPAKPVTVNGQRSFRWLVPSPREPKLQIGEMRLTRDDRLVSVAWSEEFQVRNIHYGSRGRLLLSDGGWPDLAVNEAGELGPAQLFRLMGTAAELLEWGKKPAAESAAQPGPTKR
jgi:tetratricopeptide (TPR) repeat protein